MHNTKTAQAFRLKFATDAAGTFSGYASIFGNVDSYGDVVERGAFRDTLAEHRAAGTMPLMLWQHNPDMPIGRWTELHEDEHGLFGKGQVNLESSWGRDAWAAIEGQNLDGLSIGYTVVKSRPEGILRRLDQVRLMEISVVSFPANQAARVTVQSKRELETLLTKSGLSNGAAAKVVAGGWAALVGGNDAAVEAENLEALTKAIRASAAKFRSSNNGR